MAKGFKVKAAKPAVAPKDDFVYRKSQTAFTGKEDSIFVCLVEVC